MTKIEKLAAEYADKQGRCMECGGGDDLESAFEAGFRKCREMILARLYDVGPGAPDTMGIPYDIGDEEQ